MRGVEGDVLKPRPFYFACLVDEFDGAIHVCDCGVEFFGWNCVWLTIEPKAFVAGKVIGGSGEVAKVALKAEVSGFLVEMPFACHPGKISGGSEDFGENDGPIQGGVTGLSAPTTTEEADTGRVTFGGVIELREAKAIGGEFVEVWRVDLTAVASKIGEAHVIYHDEQEVGLGVG
jgi:hypothetical protein